jgi:hypothetical protein
MFCEINSVSKNIKFLYVEVKFKTSNILFIYLKNKIHVLIKLLDKRNTS